jgi:hypothetical protein
MDTAQTIIAIIAPLESVMDPESLPAAPASESPALDPADDPTSPADGPEQLLAFWPRKTSQPSQHSPFPGCWGEEVASTEYSEETALADISGVNETDEVVAAEPWEDKGSCEVAILKKKYSIKPKRRVALILMTCS